MHDLVDESGEVKMTSYWSKDSQDFRAKVKYVATTHTFRENILKKLLSEAAKPTAVRVGVSMEYYYKYIHYYIAQHMKTTMTKGQIVIDNWCGCYSTEG